MTKIPSIEKMLKAGMHFGHQTSRWHPKMEPFIFCARNGVYIIDLVKSQAKLQEALEFLKKLSSEGKTILFVGTKNQVKEQIKSVAIDTEMAYVSEKWLGGTLTNFTVIKKLTRKFQDLTNKKKDGELEKYAKKERLDFDKKIDKLNLKVGGLVRLNKLPDALFVWDIKKEKTAIKEAKNKNIPIIAICDTNVNPSNINYIIPANDDATKTIKLVLECVKVAIIEGKNKDN